MQKKIKSNLACFLALAVFALLTAFEFIGDTLLQTSQENQYYILFAVQVVLFLVPAYILMRVQQAKAREFFRLRTYRMRWLPATLFGAMTATFGSVLLNLLVINLPLPAAMQPTVTDVFNQVTADPFAPFLAVVVAPAILEELFVHGALLSTLQHKSLFRGLLLTSLIFALLHSSLTNFLGPLFAAFVYGLLTVTFQSVYPAMIAHFLNNMLAGSILLFGQKFVEIGLDRYFVIVGAAIFLLSVFLFLLCIEPFYKKLKPTELRRDTTRYFPVGMIIFIAVWVAKNILRLYNVL